MQNYSSPSQPFNKEAYCAWRNMKGFFKRSRLCNFHLSFIHFSFPISRHVSEVSFWKHSLQRILQHFSAGWFYRKTAGLEILKVLSSQISGSLTYLENTFKYDSPHSVWVWPALPKVKYSTVFSWTQWSVVAAVCTELKVKFSPKNLHSYSMSWTPFFP